MQKIGIVGITANPPHNGHIDMIQTALKQVNSVWVIPVYQHPFSHKQNITNYEDRLEMLNLALKDINGAEVKEYDKEYCEKTGKIPYTYDLIKFIKSLYDHKNFDFSLIFGEDNKETINKFYKSTELQNENNIIFVDEKVNIHSSDIRNSLLKYKDRLNSDVLKYIKERNLYENIY